ncbi:MAG: sensor histidine kinase [Polyangiaceae bacterium]
MSLARAEHTPDDDFEPVRLLGVFEQVARELAPQLSEKHIELVQQLAGLSVHGRALDLQRLLRNLVDNALRHAPAHSTIHCTADVDGPLVTLRVSDQGPGVSDSDRERIFEPFFRSPETRGTAQQGSGLGLSIVREIARAHGGDVRVESSQQGATFAVELLKAS